MYRLFILLSLHRKLYLRHFYTSECVRACVWGGGRVSVDSYVGSGETKVVGFGMIIL
jgi:hypothetical protein